jgi:hypothetical protein
MKKITESQLKQLSARLNDRVLVESEQSVQEGPWGTAIGAGLGAAVGGAPGAAVGSAVGNWAGDKVSDWWKNGARLNPWADDPQQQAQQAQQAGTTPSPNTNPKKQHAGANPNVKAYQDALIKAGLTVGNTGADGVWGDKTRQASWNSQAAEINQQFASKIPQLAHELEQQQQSQQFTNQMNQSTSQQFNPDSVNYGLTGGDTKPAPQAPSQYALPQQGSKVGLNPSDATKQQFGVTTRESVGYDEVERLVNLIHYK